jgi:LacI family transcriptional regulator
LILPGTNTANYHRERLYIELVRIIGKHRHDNTQPFMNTSPASLKDVAAAAGVSVSTASRALNGKAGEYRISKATERAVREASERLGFRPNRVAQSFRSQRTGLIGAIVPDVANPFFAAIAREITIAAEQNGYSLLLADSRDCSDTEKRLVTQFLERRVEALLVCPVGLVSEHLAEVDQAGLPIVLIDRGFPDRRMVTVTSDHKKGANAVTQLLIAQGHKNIGVLQGFSGTLPNEERLTGIRRALAKASIQFNESFVRGDEFSESSGYDATRWLMEHHPEITALIGFSSQNTLGALRAAAEMGLQIPNDLSLVTFDDSKFANFMATPLSTASQDIAELGRLAATLIVDRIKSGKRSRKKMYRVPIEIIERCSIGAARQKTHPT